MNFTGFRKFDSWVRAQGFINFEKTFFSVKKCWLGCMGGQVKYLLVHYQFEVGKVNEPP